MLIYLLFAEPSACVGLRERACVCVGVFVCAPFGPIELN